MWNGAAEALKPRPEMIIASPRTSSTSCERPSFSTCCAISTKPIWFVAPYTSADPNSSDADPNEPTIRYFSPASSEPSRS